MGQDSERIEQQKQHPVWEVYDLLRTARLSHYYYAAKADSLSRKNLFIEIFLAITVPTSAVSAWALWQTDWGAYVWGAIAGIGSLVAIVKPLLKLTEKIKAYESLASRYRTAEGELAELRSDIVHKKKYDKPLQDRFRQTMRAMKRLTDHAPVERLDEQLRLVLENRVKKELPKEGFHIPQE
jgi:hypothetical protein